MSLRGRKGIRQQIGMTVASDDGFERHIVACPNCPREGKITMFTIQDHQEKYRIYTLRDEEAQSWLKVAPERGGIITEFGVKNHNFLYLDEATFNDPATSVRGGIPVLFPICGQLENDQYQWNGKQYKMKPHGFARNHPWQVVGTETNGQSAIKLRFAADAQTQSVYPFDFELIFTYALKGNQLTITQEYHNHSETMMPVYAGFHPYFLAGDKSKIMYDTDGTIYLDYEDKKIKPFRKDFDLTNVSIAKLILDQAKNGLSFQDPVLGHRIRLQYGREFRYPLLWSSVGKNFICVEPFMAKMNALNTHEDIQLIKPGGVLATYLTITGEICV